MLANEMELSLNPTKFTINSHILGAFAMFCAPMLLLFFMFGTIDSSAPKTFKDQLVSLTGVFYIGGWIAGAIGMRRLRATGDRLGSKIVFIIQIALLSFALLFSVMEVFGYSYENGGLLFAIADAGYPLSHLFMIVVGIFVLRAKVWRGLPRIAPFLVGFALPAFSGLSLIVGTGVGGFGFGLLTATGLGIIGYTVFRQS
ncbi:MAG: hypothetical protein ABWZ66_08835 [Pyrinomonadaceae bacterium]